jgi:hypothetical protein
MVENPLESSELRDQALASLVNMQDATAWLPVADDLLSWADGGWDPRLEGPAIPGRVRLCVGLAAVQMPLPDAQALDMLRRAYPQGWERLLAHWAEQGYGEALKKRAGHLLGMASAAETGKKQDVPESPGTPP